MPKRRKDITAPMRAGSRFTKPMGGEYRFKLDAYTPDSIPMARLAEYMTALADILGERQAVHFKRLIRGSTVLACKVEREAMPKVNQRVDCVKKGEGPSEAMRGYKTLNKLLRDDNAVGLLKSDRGVVLRFPGRTIQEEKFEAVRQYGSVDGVVVWVGGADETKHVTLKVEGREIAKFSTTQAIAKELGQRLFEPVRLAGRGRWERDADGLWTLLDFKVESYEALDAEPLSKVLADLREVKTDWGPDALNELGMIRHGPKGPRNGGH
jgi:hypothetical protein